MRALLWKDYRMNRALVIAALVLLIAPYAIGIAVQFHDARSTGMWGGTVAASSLAAMATSLLVISLLAANAFTQERAERSAEFLTHLPPTRGSILASKLILAGTVSTFVWIVNLSIGLILAPRLGQFEPSLEDPVKFLLPTSVLLFGAGWAASTVLSSPVGAWAVASGAPMLIGGIILSSWYFLEIPAQEHATDVYIVASFVVGVTALAVSSVLFIRRVGV